MIARFSSTKFVHSRIYSSHSSEAKSGRSLTIIPVIHPLQPSTYRLLPSDKLVSWNERNKHPACRQGHAGQAAVPPTPRPGHCAAMAHSSGRESLREHYKGGDENSLGYAQKERERPETRHCCNYIKNILRKFCAWWMRDGVGVG